MIRSVETVSIVDAFRELMACVCTPVSVVTALVDDGPHGTTVSAFASLSLDPPMVMVALDADSQLLALVGRSRRFGVNILGDQQAGLARKFAVKGRDKFAGVRWTEDHGLPKIDAVAGWLACDVADLVGGGDHVIVLGKVLATHTVSIRPLTYHRRTFGTHAAIEG